MWIASLLPSKLSHQDHENLLDLLLGLSPHIASISEGRAVLLSMGSVSRYWNMAELPSALKAQSPFHTPQVTYEKNSKVLAQAISTLEHPLLKKLEELSLRYGLHFTMAPTAAWAYWAASCEASTLETQSSIVGLHSPVLSFYDRDSIVEKFFDHKLHSTEFLIADKLSDKHHLKPELHYFFEMSRDLGLTKVSDLMNFLKTPSLRESLLHRFGPVVEKILRRLSGADDWELTWHQPTEFLKTQFSPRLESMMSSEKAESKNPLERIREIFQLWEERLRARKSLIAGLCVEIITNRRRSKHEILVTSPKPTRDSENFYKIFLEKWLKLCSDSQHLNAASFEDEIDDIEIRSLRLESDHDRQLNLFDPHREEIDEKWNVLVGQLRARATNKHRIQIGGYRPFESYFPENALEWVDWEQSSHQPPSPLSEHPRRPVLLLKHPLYLDETRHIQDEETFLKFIESKEALNSIEKMRDPWRAGALKAQSVQFEEDVAERSYARIDGQWIFFDHAQKRIFLHGYFE